MNMQKTSVGRWMLWFFPGPLLLTILLLTGCGDDPQPPNEEELITTVTVTLTPSEGNPITMTFKDLDGIGAGEPVYAYSSGGDTAVLSSTTTYTAEITLLNESVSPAKNITEEIEEEADQHLFCFTPEGGVNINVTYADEDSNALPVGLTTNWETEDAGTGTITIALRHQPGNKTGVCPGSGDTDVQVVFNVVVE